MPRSGDGNLPAAGDVYVCGPPPMTEAVVAALRELGLPRGQVHYERFGLG